MSIEAELEPIQSIVREVLINVQNSSSATLFLTTFTLTHGQWDPKAPNGVPMQGFQVDPGTDPTWGNATGVAFTDVAGKMTFVANATTIGLSWSWNYSSNPDAAMTITGGATLQGTVSIQNESSSICKATFQLTGR